MESMESVILVPGIRRLDLADFDGVMIQAEDCDTWRKMSDSEQNALKVFLDQERTYTGGRTRGHIRIGFARVGFAETGVYLHENHLKRYFGLKRSHANIMLLNMAPEALRKVETPIAGGGLLSALAANMPTIGQDVRKSFLKATFSAADSNGNGRLSRAELGTLMRRLLYTWSAEDCREMMERADADENDDVSYDEFVEWLERNDPGALEKSLLTDADLVRATFRLWDKDGNGVVSKQELQQMMGSCGMRPSEVKTLVDVLDTDDDGDMDYDEFVDFVFKRSVL